MRKIAVGIACCLVWICIGTVVLAGPRSIGTPGRYDQSIDRRLTQVTVGETTWSAWAYRNAGQFDIALSVADESGRWTEPTLVGADDGRDQVEPALTADAAGRFFLAYADRESGQVFVTTLPPGATDWSVPQAIGRGSAPALIVVGDQLVVAFRSGLQTRMVRLPIPIQTETPERFGTHSIYDGPDPVERSGEGEEDTGQDEDHSTGTIRPIGLDGNGEGNHPIELPERGRNPIR